MRLNGLVQSPETARQHHVDISKLEQPTLTLPVRIIRFPVRQFVMRFGS